MKNSTGTRNYLAAGGSLLQLAAGARAFLFSGVQPASADTAPTGTSLVPLTKSAGAYTGETLAEWKTTLSGSAGQLDALLLGGQVLAGTASAGAATTITLAGGTATDDIYNNMYVITTGGTGPGQIRKITDYVGSTTVASVATWDVTPDNTTTFIVVAGVNLMSGVIAYTDSLTATNVLAVAAIASFIGIPDLTAYSDTDKLYVVAPKGSGAELNGLKLFAVASGGLTATVANAGRPNTLGVACVNGLTWVAPAADGAIAKEAAALQGNATAAGTIGFMRLCLDPADDGTTTSTTYKRQDYSVGVGSGDVQLASLQVVISPAATPVIINTFPLTVAEAGV